MRRCAQGDGGIGVLGSRMQIRVFWMHREPDPHSRCSALGIWPYRPGDAEQGRLQWTGCAVWLFGLSRQVAWG
jgi:hypothetical protein